MYFKRTALGVYLYHVNQRRQQATALRVLFSSDFYFLSHKVFLPHRPYKALFFCNRMTPNILL